VFVSVDVGSFR